MIYLDHAATSYPKPPGVTEAQARCMRSECGNPGRGSHRLAMRAAEKIYECRVEAASFFGSTDPSNVIFTMNTTMALNMAIKGLLHEGDHVLISDLEHNSVYRPIFKLAAEGLISYDVFPTYVLSPGAGADDICRAIEEKIRPNTRMLICAHASNICSSVMPLEEIGQVCRRHGLLFVVDGAQSAGHIPIDVERMRIDALCLPGHKGLLGPQGCGMMVLGSGVVANTLLEGGSGYQSLDGMMPQESPERYEAGTLPTPSIAGLCEGIRCVRQLGVEKISKRISAWNRRLLSGLEEIPGITVYAKHHVGAILLFNMAGFSADEVGRALDDRGFCVRTGYHCSALGHATLQTPNGGAVRVSPGLCNSFAECDAFLKAIAEIRGERNPII